MLIGATYSVDGTVKDQVTKNSPKLKSADTAIINYAEYVPASIVITGGTISKPVVSPDLVEIVGVKTRLLFAGINGEAVRIVWKSFTPLPTVTV